MPTTDRGARARVTPDDVQESVRLASAALGAVTSADWQVPAGALEWSCWDTVEHLCDDYFGYAAQLGPEKPSLTSGVPFTYMPREPGGPANTVFADVRAGNTGLIQVLEACGAMLTAMVRTAPAGVRAWHPYGVSDPEGFAAMGIVETLVHVHDVAQGLGFPWTPPAGLCERVLHRLFRDVQTGADPWPALLWATGRAELPGFPRRTSWRWDGTPLPADAPAVPQARQGEAPAAG
ncbi:maleylpyruvate isomerase N-terminal domain-containing protein [Streptomyces ovatisporus]|uniref:Maleylpyruvate isomerase N-terminal domain-containing protein n=1 Tax=Streptomyces ovatisporus TaxID=1128682 RepID=A0ABV9ABP3_9ACTN